MARLLSQDYPGLRQSEGPLQPTPPLNRLQHFKPGDTVLPFAPILHLEAAASSPPSQRRLESNSNANVAGNWNGSGHFIDTRKFIWMLRFPPTRDAASLPPFVRYVGQRLNSLLRTLPDRVLLLLLFRPMHRNPGRHEIVPLVRPAHGVRQSISAAYSLTRLVFLGRPS